MTLKQLETHRQQIVTAITRVEKNEAETHVETTGASGINLEHASLLRELLGVVDSRIALYGSPF